MEKVHSKLKASEKEKSSIPSENTIDLNKDNVTRKKNLQQNSEHVDHRDTNPGREDFNHISKLVTIVKNKEKGPYKKYTGKDRYNIGKYASENGPVAAEQKFRLKCCNLNESTVRVNEKKLRRRAQPSFTRKLLQQRLHLSNLVGL